MSGEMVNSRPHMPKTPSAPPRGRRSRATSPGRDPDPDPNGDNPTRTKSARAAFLMAGLELRPFRRAAPRFDLCATSIDREGGRRNFAYQILRARWRDGEIVTRLIMLKTFFRANGRGQLGRRRKYGPRSGTERTKLQAQLPCWWRHHRSERPRSKDQHHLQLCAKPPLHPMAARRASAPSLPASGTFARASGGPPRPAWASFPRCGWQVRAAG
jgi:hypothetical protein